MSENQTGVMTRLGNALLFLFTILLVILAIALTAVRFHPDISSLVENKIESKLADIINADINIESFDLDRHQFSPKIMAENVMITDRDDPQNAWPIKKVFIGVDLLGSLLSRSLRVTEIIVEGIDFEVHRDIDGNININQTFLIPVGSMNNNPSGGNIGNVQIQLTDSNLVWRDEQLNLEYVFNEINMLIGATEKGHRLSLVGQLPSEMGDSIELHARIDGDIRQIHTASASFHIKASKVVTHEISSYFFDNKRAILPVIADIEFWGNSQGLSLQSLRGDVFLDQVATEASHINKGSCLTSSYIKTISGQFLWEADDQGWSLNAKDLYVESSTEDWPAGYLHISQNNSPDNLTSYHANLGFIKLDDVCNTLHAYAEYGLDVEHYLRTYQLNGKAADVLLRADLENNILKSLQYAGDVKDLELRMRKSGKLIKGISGYAKGSLHGGQISLDAERLVVGLPDIYKASPLEFGVQGDLHWQREEQHVTVSSNPLRIYNNDVALDMRWYGLLAGDQVYVDSQLALPETRANVIWKYFPNLKKTKRTKNWLRQALHQGDVKDAKIMLRGNMRKFPFQQHAGVFETRADISNGRLEFKRDWPKLEDVRAKLKINDAQISVSSEQARMFTTKVKNVDIRIDSFLRAVMHGKGTAEGSAKDLLEFLDQSGLVSGENSIINTIGLAGDSRLELDFSRSLSRKINHPFEVSGDLHLLGNTLDIFSVGLQLKDIGGKFSFDKSGASAESVTASLYGQPVTLAATPVGAGVTNISFFGPFKLEQYVEQKFPDFADIISGGATIDGVLRLPSLFKRDNPEKISLKVNSDLVGVEVNLPRPLAKDKNTSLASSLVYLNKENSLQLDVGKHASVHFAGSPKQPLQLQQITLGDAANREAANNEVLLINGKISQLPLDDWLAVKEKYLSKSKVNNDKINLPNIDIVIDELLWKTWPAKDLSLQSERLDDVYRISIRSPKATGLISVPDQDDLPVTANFENLILSQAEEKPDVMLDPGEVRPFLFTSKKLSVNELSFKNVIVRAVREQKGLSFNKIQLEAQDLKIHGSGAWRLVDLEKAQSFFNLELVSIDIEDSLEDIGFKSSVHSGELDSIINLRWDGAPQQFSLDSGQGSATVNAYDGRIKEVNPGNAGRLLALLNLSAITRRLSLDFKDVTKEGFSFDKITGTFHLKPGGILQADDVTMESSSAKVVISGYTNLKNKTYDQKILVTPAISGTLPAAGAIVGGPVGAAAGLLADQVVKAVGLNRVSVIEYKMTGTWENPKLEKLGSILVKPAKDK